MIVPSFAEDPSTQAMLKGHVIAESGKKAPKTQSDLECPHGVRFYDVVIDGARHERAAWSYQVARSALQKVAGRFGSWKYVEVGLSSEGRPTWLCDPLLPRRSRGRRFDQGAG